MPVPDLGIVLFLGIFMIVCASALMVVTSPNLVHSAVSLLFTLFGIAAIYIYLYADFIAATQVVIYVGGILVLIILITFSKFYHWGGLLPPLDPASAR